MLVGMRIEDASAKIRDVGVHDDEEDYAAPGLDRAGAAATGARRAGGMPAPVPGLDAAPPAGWPPTAPGGGSTR